MIDRAKSHVKANLIGYLALFIALGGTSYAAATLPKNSVGTRQLKNGAVTGRKVKAHSLLAKDFKSGQLRAGPRGLRGLQGPQGLQGVQGLQGLQGPAGPSHAFAQLQSPQVTIPSGNASTVVTTVTLPAGTYVLDATVQLINTLSGESLALCFISANPNDGSQNSLNNANLPGDVQTAPVLTVATLQAQTSVSLECHVLIGGPIKAQAARLVAVAVGDLTGS